MMSQKTLKSLLDPSHGVPYTEDFDAMTLAKNLVSGSLTENLKCTKDKGFEINIQKDYSLSDLLTDKSVPCAEEYYTVPYKSAMWNALEDTQAKKNIGKAIAAVPGDTDKEKLDFLTKCNCCERHNTNKPGHWETRVHIPETILNHSVCKCSCRHMARLIVGEY